MGDLRRSFLSGSWYPGDEQGILGLLGRWAPYIGEKGAALGMGAKDRGIAFGVVPHAGWAYSGKLAASVISAAKGLFGAGDPELVLVLGGHLPQGAGIVCYREDAWDTPLSPMPLAPGLNGDLSGLGPGLPLRLWDGPTDDNTIEVVLPLVRHYFPGAAALAMRVPPDPSSVALGDALAALTRGRRSLVLASTDLTHYGDAYGFAPAGPGKAGLEFREKNDLAFIEAALALDCGGILSAANERRAACSAGAVAALARMAAGAGARGGLLDRYASSDVSGDGRLSVGYAGMLFAG
jgi:AmmeMemoRadiSam system protein B